MNNPEIMDAPTQIETRTPRARRPGPWKIDNIVELRAVLARIDTAIGDNINAPAEARKVVLDHIEHVHFRGRMIAQERLQQGADGLDTARLLSAIQDVIMKAISYYVEKTKPKDDGDEGLGFAIIATGGYGRKVLAPNSDIDLLFLTTPKPTQSTKSNIEAILYLLWDLKLKVGYATRTALECIKMSEEDVSIKTALLDARLIAGDPSYFDIFTSFYNGKIRGQGGSQFIEDKLGERDAVANNTGRSPYVVEPHVKQGVGGLRDIQTLFWISKFYADGTYFEDVLDAGGFSTSEKRIFMDAARFLWTVRCHLHFLTGRAEDRLNFELQPEIARRMYYKDRGEQLGVERFMKRYFLVVRDVRILVRVLVARLDTRLTSARTGVLTYLGQTLHAKFLEANLPSGFEYDQNKISVSNPKGLENNPTHLVKIFLLERDSGNEIHPETFLHIRRAARHLSVRDLDAPELREDLLDAISGKNVEAVLRRLTEADVLGRLIPEFGQIVAQTQFNMYHHFTIDEHTLQAIGGLERMETGAWSVDKAESLFKQIKHRRALYLAMLLHDTGKGQGDQQILGEQTSMAACRRLGLEESETELVGWLVRNHLEMSETAQKRDISDPKTVLDFVHRVKTIERLNLLYLLTCADINAVGPGVFNQWKGQLLSELHSAATSALRGNRTDESTISKYYDERAVDLKHALRAQLGQLPAIMESLEPAYWLSTDESRHLAHADWLNEDNPDQIRTKLTYNDKTQLAELLVSGKDRKGLFLHFVQAITALGGDIVSAHIFSGADNSDDFLDIFSIELDQYNANTVDLKRWNKNLNARLNSTATDSDDRLNNYSGIERKKTAFIVNPEISFNNSLSTHHTVLEITAANENGVLKTICEVLVEHDISIISAHISSFGERVFDVFYVQNVQGEKLPQDYFETVFQPDLINRLMRFGQTAPSTAIRELERSESAKSY